MVTSLLISAGTFTPQTDAVGGSLPITALVGMLPLIVFFILLGGVRVAAHWSALGALATSLLLAVIAFKMPVGMAFFSASEGAAVGLMPILWIVITAIWLYELTELSGRNNDMRAVFSIVGKGDKRVQAMLIAFCFGGLLEALAGFGAPVAITASMVVALGIPPIRAAMVVLIANTAPVAFGAMAAPIVMAGKTGETPDTLIAATVGHQTPLLAVWIPLLLVFLVDGKRGVKQTWPVAMVTGVAFALAQWWASNHFVFALTDVVAALCGFLAAWLFLQVWSPKTPEDVASHVKIDRKLTFKSVALATMPYWLVCIIFSISKLGLPGINVPKLLSATDITFKWPGLSELNNIAGKPQGGISYTLPWLSTPGTGLLITGIIVALTYALTTKSAPKETTFGQGISQLFTVIVKMRWAILTISSIVALAYVMNFSGQTQAIGVWLSGLGAAFAFLSPILGWIGTAVTGSDTSANALFGAMQKTAATNLHIRPDLLLAANTDGGIIGKLVSPQNLTIAATAIDKPGSEGEILRKVMPYSLVMLILLSLLVLFQSTDMGAWMLPDPANFPAAH